MVTNTTLDIVATFSLPGEFTVVKCLVKSGELQCRGYGADEQHYRSVHYRSHQ